MLDRFFCGVPCLVEADVFEAVSGDAFSRRCCVF
jgi:hypothetical protein